MGVTGKYRGIEKGREKRGRGRGAASDAKEGEGERGGGQNLLKSYFPILAFVQVILWPIS